jgi:hypothetical protein
MLHYYVLVQYRNNKLKGIQFKESAASLFEFYRKLTATDNPVKERAFHEYYSVERTLTGETLDHLAQCYSSGDHRAFTLRHFKALHAFSGKEYGWADIEKTSMFQVCINHFL